MPITRLDEQWITPPGFTWRNVEGRIRLHIAKTDRMGEPHLVALCGVRPTGRMSYCGEHGEQCPECVRRLAAMEGKP